MPWEGLGYHGRSGSHPVPSFPFPPPSSDLIDRSRPVTSLGRASPLLPLLSLLPLSLLLEPRLIFAQCWRGGGVVRRRVTPRRPPPRRRRLLSAPIPLSLLVQDWPTRPAFEDRLVGVDGEVERLEGRAEAKKDGGALPAPRKRRPFVEHLGCMGVTLVPSMILAEGRVFFGKSKHTTRPSRGESLFPRSSPKPSKYTRYNGCFHG